MENALSTESCFIKPYFIEELGEDGLTARDIAISLGVRTRDVVRKCKRGDWQSGKVATFRSVTYVALQEFQEVTGHSYTKEMEVTAFNTAAAKLFVARWGNEKSDRYLEFLFACEHIATEVTPKLIETIKTLQGELEEHVKHGKRLQDQLNLLAAPKKPHGNKNTVIVPVPINTLFGTGVEYRRVPRNDPRHSDLSFKEGELKRLAQLLTGMTRKVDDLTREVATLRRR